MAAASFVWASDSWAWLCKSSRECRAWTRDHVFPREAAWFATAGFSLLAFILVVLCWLDPQTNILTRWAQQRWAPANCSVIGAGVQYLGDCQEHESFGSALPPCEPAPNGSDCSALATAWHGAAPGTLARRLTVPQSSVFVNQCQNLWLTWAHLRVGTHEGCGFRNGFSSQSRTDSKDEASAMLAALRPGSSAPCWLLTARPSGHGPGGPGPCELLALQNPREWPEVSARLLAWRALARAVLLAAALATGSLAAATAVAQGVCRQAGVRAWGDLRDKTEGSSRPPAGAEPLAELSESARVLDVQERWAFFQASIHGEYQLVSARE